MRSSSRSLPTLLLTVVSLSGSSALAEIRVTHQALSGIPKGGNARIAASVPPDTTVSSARVYFNAEGKAPEYYLEMVRGEGGAFWAVLPIPKSQTKKAEYRLVFRDAEGKETVLPRVTVPVDSSKPSLSDAELRYAKNLVIGVTDPKVELLPDGWECYGVVSSINVQGELKPNELCRMTVIPPALWVGAGTAAAAVGAVVVSSSDDGPKQPVSPSRPGPTPR